MQTLPLGTARKQQESVARRRIHRTAQASDDNLVVGNAAEAPTQTNALSAVIGGAGLVTGSTGAFPVLCDSSCVLFAIGVIWRHLASQIELLSRLILNVAVQSEQEF